MQPPSPSTYNPSVLAGNLSPYEGYVTAFYELGELMGIGAQAVSPDEVWREKMLTALKKMWAEREMKKYAIALQHAIEYHCDGEKVPESVAKECPHHSRMLNGALKD